MTAVLERAAELNSAKGAEDLTKPTEGGGFERELPKAGIALLRLNSYIELGKVQPKNKTWKPSVQCILTFELLHPNHMIEPEGKPAFPMTYTVRVPKSLTKGSRYIKLFNAMNWETNKDGSAKHTNFNTMIGNTAWRGNLHERTSGEGKDKKTYINLNNAEGVWDIGAPSFERDPINEPGVMVNIPVPEMHQTGKLFFWENPAWNEEIIKAAWDTLYIEGENDDGKSKNWIQDAISSPANLDWNGSLTKQVVEGGVIDLPTELTGADQDPTDTPFVPDEKPVAKTSEVDADAAALAALGL